jgi:hypothetical protein
MIGEYEAMKMLEEMTWDDNADVVVEVAEIKEVGEDGAADDSTGNADFLDEDTFEQSSGHENLSEDLNSKFVNSSWDNGVVSLSGDACVEFTPSLLDRWSADVESADVEVASGEGGGADTSTGDTEPKKDQDVEDL